MSVNLDIDILGVSEAKKAAKRQRDAQKGSTIRADLVQRVSF